MRRFVSRSLVGSAAVAALLLGSAVAVQASESAGGSVPVAVAASKKTTKKLSVTAFTKKIDRVVRKRMSGDELPQFATKRVSGTAAFKASKQKRWFVAMNGVGYKARGWFNDGVTDDDSYQEYFLPVDWAKRYRAEVVREFKKAGLKSIGTIRAGDVAVTSYRSTRFSCTVTSNLSTKNTAVRFSCAKTAKVKRAVKKAAPFKQAYHRSGARLRGLTFWPAEIVETMDSPTSHTGASVTMAPATALDDRFVGLFSQRVGKSWKFVGIE